MDLSKPAATFSKSVGDIMREEEGVDALLHENEEDVTMEGSERRSYRVQIEISR